MMQVEKTFRVGVLVSGGGTGLQSLLDAKTAGQLPGVQFCVVVSSRAQAYALERAQCAGIPTHCASRARYPDPEAHDTALVELLEAYQLDLVITAGYLSILGPKLIQKYKNALINIHPSLLPAFGGHGFYGLKVHEHVLDYGVKVTGATVHLIDLEVDSGPIILQKAVVVQSGDTPELLQQRVMQEAEAWLLPKAVQLLATHKLIRNGRQLSFEAR
jgi:phosphoribosylglycinamide formyltransferase 1